VKNWLALLVVVSVTASAVSASIPAAQADTYHRFWRGTKRADLSWTQFETGLNQIFIPATVKTGAGNGMSAYEPILLEGTQGLPDEVALVSYTDLATYNSLYSTDFGKAYQNLHWQYFDRAHSNSTVPEAFAGSVQLEHAYDLRPQYAGWMKNKTTVLIYLRAPEEMPVGLAGRAQAHLNDALVQDSANGILNRVALVSQNYWIEYVSADHALGAETGASLVVPVQSENPHDADIVLKQGVNLQF
jgi:hypothetical protein